MLCNQGLSRLKVENHVKISFILLCYQVLSHLKQENRVKITFIVLCNQALSRLKVENHFKIFFIMLCNQVLIRQLNRKSYKIEFKCQNQNIMYYIFNEVRRNSIQTHRLSNCTATDLTLCCIAWPKSNI